MKKTKCAKNRRRFMKPLTGTLAAALLLGGMPSMTLSVSAAVDFGWEEENGNWYWYENGVRQGYDPDNAAYRGKEIYDPGSDAWYWLDNVDQGKKAVSKDVYQESLAGNWAGEGDGTGKWVRYDENGHMIKGWDANENGTYYFDPVYGTMAKGYAVIDGSLHYFDKATGVESPAGWDGINGWVVAENIDGNCYWYENGVRQGYDPDNAAYRGKEIYDPESDAWYWLDNVDQGKKAVSKDVYQESAAGKWAASSDGTGKWVRYDAQGHMVKGWSTNENGTYYFDPIYGTMAKGVVTIDGKQYEFNQGSGILEKELPDTDTGSGDSGDTDDSGDAETKADLSKCTVTLSESSYTYDGTEKKPAVTVKNGSTTIPDSEYTVSYSNNVNVGTATVTITAKSGSTKVTGSKSVTFTVIAAETKYQGTYGNVEWQISTNGKLTITGECGRDGLLWEGQNYSYSSPWYSSRNSITSAYVNVKGAKNLSHLFYDCSNLTSVKFGDLDTSDVTDMHCMFYCCSDLSSVDVNSFDTGNVTNMGAMFSGCSSLTSLDLSSFDTSNVTDMDGMFRGCRTLSSLNLSSFDTTNVMYMSAMFSGCSALSSLDLSNFNTSNITNMYCIFYNCSTLSSVNLSSLDTRNVTSMMGMFDGCSSLSSVDLSSFDTSNVTSMTAMFNNCSNLTNIAVGSGWQIKEGTNTDHMFENCGTDHVTLKSE